MAARFPPSTDPHSNRHPQTSDFTQKKATSYGLTGYVKNTNDGKVVGEAQGAEDALKKLKGDLNQGPRAAHVVKLEVRDIQTKDGEASFDA
ncbi:uncharacterized protein A1O9_09231 [Exophiala aquamarina CBS 119918]|uniref:acylphosphatase n=1 Tax=Exophiala aquamarina CBS 119918 TaxID=1182545 RepID=A0A072P3Y3_9EURO|nr:uncharacterized protein A1O9_09231 [Exophiala aquamarina CBS 119918]KEF54789.1 hypothetical protein A1O9_09231 [Exophiala aquamarina CBS 119918]